MSQDVNRAVFALCQFVGEDPLRRFSLFDRLHPALLLHWRVQAHLVSRLGPDLRRDYQELWAQELIGGRPLCPSFSRLHPRLLALRTGTPPNPPSPQVLGSISVEESEDQEDQESNQALPEPAGALEP